ncbi:MAG: hypothetical protein M1814_003609 [Vezdaea aestivalis]|nr:MAG: hypothetical protein M1814_003609 [Vezdaea aestivalis]
MSTTAYASSYIYTGFWTNWSKDSIHGATLTLPGRQAGFLGAFLAIFVSATGGQFWKIACFVIHQARAGRKRGDAGDLFHRQTQVIFKNSGSSITTMWDFFSLPFDFRGQRLTRILKCIFLGFVALTNLAAFATASILTSQITKVPGNTTLVYSKNCGYATFPSGFDPSFSKILRVMRLAESAANYARECYGAVYNPIQCNTYPRSQIQYATTKNVPCPFAANRCINNLSVAFDTGHINTHDVFGINAPKHERITYRRVTTCAPINLDDVTRDEHFGLDNLDSTDGTFKNVYAGPVNYGFGSRNSSAPTFSQNLQGVSIGGGSAYAVAGGGWGQWLPIKDLNRTDADVTIMFISFNNIDFVASNDDPIFSAHVPSRSPVGIPAFKPDKEFGVLACAEQHQYCNPNKAEGAPDRCTALTGSELVWGSNTTRDISLLEDTGIKALENNNIGLNDFQKVLAGYSATAQSAGMYFAVFSRGVAAISASETVYQFLQSPLPNDQWLIELSKWFSVGLAGIQQGPLEFATGPQYVGESGTIVRPDANDTFGRQLCKSQVIRESGQYQSFSVLGMSLVLGLGGLIIILSFTVEPAVSHFQRKHKKGNGRREQWEQDDKLHLLMADAARQDSTDMTVADSSRSSEDLETEDEKPGGKPSHASFINQAFFFERRSQDIESTFAEKCLEFTGSGV